MKLLSGFQLHPEMTGKKSMVHFIFLRQPPDLILYIAGGVFKIALNIPDQNLRYPFGQQLLQVTQCQSGKVSRCNTQ